MKKAKDYIVFPLDVPSGEDAKRLVGMLAEDVGVFKVGLELFIQSGSEIIKFIQSAGSCRIFLDLKLHDIPETVSRAMRRIAALGIDFITVHCGESRRMLDAAVAASQGNLTVLAVTILTSVSVADIRAAGYRPEFCTDMTALALRRAEMAKAAGCSGIVCSGHDAKSMRKQFGRNFVIVTPGIRPQWSVLQKDDQQRITTVIQAVQSGSDYLVIGRPIRDAQDPRAAARQIAAEIETVIQG